MKRRDAIWIIPAVAMVGFFVWRHFHRIETICDQVSYAASALEPYTADPQSKLHGPALMLESASALCGNYSD